MQLPSRAQASASNSCRSSPMLRASRIAPSVATPWPPRGHPSVTVVARSHHAAAVAEQPHQPPSNGFAYPPAAQFIYAVPTVEDFDGPAARAVHRDDAPTSPHPTPSTSGAAHEPVPTEQPAHKYKYPRVLLKISGEALQGQQGFGVDPAVLNLVAEEIAESHRAGLQLAVVVGGGNYFRGASAPKGMDRAQADYVGMLATVMNALLLQGALESMGVATRVQTAIEMREVAEPYIRRRAIRHLEERRVVIFGAGTGNPFFTTDTAAALRAAEMQADVFMKATKVDGVYDCDPKKFGHAKKYERLSYRQVSYDNLQVMDETAITLCKENSIPVLVFNVMERGNVLRAAQGFNVGTVVDAAS